MINGGNATVYVSDLKRSVDFYAGVLGLKVKNEFSGEWADIDAGNGLILGLQPTRPHSPTAGRSGSITVGFQLTIPLEEAMQQLKKKGVQFKGPIQGDEHAPIRIAFFNDPDGNELYLCEVQQKW